MAVLRVTPVLTLVLVLAAFGGGSTALGPGDELGAMTLTRGTAAKADLKLFDACDPVVRAPGRYVRRCPAVARVSRLFIGYGQFDLPQAIDKSWKSSTWAAWLDGHPIDLRRFGTSDRTLVAFPPAGGKTVTLREWRVMLIKGSSGQHTLRYRFRDTDGVVDAAWVFTVSRR